MVSGVPAGSDILVLGPWHYGFYRYCFHFMLRIWEGVRHIVICKSAEARLCRE